MLCKSWAFWGFLPQVQVAEFVSSDWFCSLCCETTGICQGSLCSHLGGSRELFKIPEVSYSQSTSIDFRGTAWQEAPWVTRPVLSLFSSALLQWNVSFPQRERARLGFQPGRRNPKQNWDFYPAAQKIHLKLIRGGSRMTKPSGAGLWPGCCGGQVGSGSAGWKWVRKGEKGKNWMAECFSSIQVFFLLFPAFQQSEIPAFFGVHTHRKAQPLPQEVPNSTASSKWHFLTQSPLIIQALIIFCCSSSFVGFVLPRMME